jgi:hypothetical protein
MWCPARLLPSGVETAWRSVICEFAGVTSADEELSLSMIEILRILAILARDRMASFSSLS